MSGKEQSVRVVVHAVVSDGDIPQFYSALKSTLQELIQADIIKDVQCVEENIRVLMPWNLIRSQLKQEPQQP